MKSGVFKKVVAGFRLNYKDIVELRKLVDLYHLTANSHYKEISELSWIVGIDPNPSVEKAFEMYVELIACHPKFIDILISVFDDCAKIFNFILKGQIKIALSQLEDCLRKLCINCIVGTSYDNRLYQRILFYEVGYSLEYSTCGDLYLANEYPFTKLTDFERWMMKDVISSERVRKSSVS